MGDLYVKFITLDLDYVVSYKNLVFLISSTKIDNSSTVPLQWRLKSQASSRRHSARNKSHASRCSELSCYALTLKYLMRRHRYRSAHVKIAGPAPISLISKARLSGQ